MTTRIACPHCGVLDWTRAPRLKRVLDLVSRRKETTARDVADLFGLSIANASNQLTVLARMGVIERGEWLANPGGGRYRVYRPARAEARS